MTDKEFYIKIFGLDSLSVGQNLVRFEQGSVGCTGQPCTCIEFGYVGWPPAM